MDAPILLLFAEDEPLIQEMAQDGLETGGYTVIPVATGLDAIEILETRLDEIAGLITDIRLGAAPDGWEVARRARALKPLIPVVYTTGDSAHEWPTLGVPKSVCLQKPYAPAQLIIAISTLLIDAPNSTTSSE